MRTSQDNKPGTSAEDRRFMEIMENGMTKVEDGNWEAPLPFRHEIRELLSSRDCNETPEIHLPTLREETHHEGPVL